MLGVLPVVLDGAALAGLFKQLLDVLGILSGDAGDLRKRLGLALAHLEHDLRGLIRRNRAVQNDVRRIGLGQLLDTELLRKTVGDPFYEIKQNLSCHKCVPFLFM